MSLRERAPGERFAWRGREIAWERLGDGPPVVLVHGTPWSSALWRPVAEALAERYAVHLYDLAGYGASSKRAEHPVDLGVQGELLADLLRHWGLAGASAGAARPHVIAHDIGGATALRARLLHDVRFASLALVDVVALRPWGSPFFRLVQEHAAVFAQLPAAIHRGVVEAYVRGASSRPLDDADLAVLVAPWLDEDGQAAFYRQIAQADERFTAQVEDRLGEIDEPVHVVWGADDAWIPVDRAHRLRALMPAATLTEVAGAGHLIHLDAGAELLAALRSWLAAQAHHPS